jgi:hypothetical protein
VLGPHPREQGVGLLAQALVGDEYRWVRYGAARSLVEAASRLNHPRRQEVIDLLRRFVAGYGGGAAYLNHLVLLPRPWGRAAAPTTRPGSPGSCWR